MGFKRLINNNIISITGAVSSEAFGTRVLPAWKRGISNYVSKKNGGIGENTISFPNGYEIHGDLLFVVGWGDGAAIYRIENNGTLTTEWNNDGNSQVLYRDTTSTYNHITNIVLSKSNYKAVIMTHNVNGYTVVDYKGLVDGTTNGGEAVKEDRPSSQYFFSSGGVNIDRAGESYRSGVTAAGDWIYICDYDNSHTKKYPRRNLVTDTQELLEHDDIAYTGSTLATNVTSGYRATLFYDEYNDRVYYNYYQNGRVVVILDASTSSPECVYVDVNNIGFGDDMYENGLFVPDPINYPNRVMLGVESRIGHIDYTPCFSGNSPTKLNDAYVEATTEPGYNGAHFRVGTKYQTTTTERTDKLPNYPNFVPTAPDRGRNTLGGWMCWENTNLYRRAVGAYNSGGIVEDTTTGGRGRSVRIDYGTPPVRMKSADGTHYWILMGYGADGYQLWVYANDIGQGLIGDWSVVYGTFTLPNNANIDGVTTDVLTDFFIPGGCSIAVKVSNNNGSTWEDYTGTDELEHSFEDEGNQLRVKVEATGFVDKAPYSMELGAPSVHYRTKSTIEKHNITKFKRTRFRLKK
jgi:hypothetical protein